MGAKKIENFDFDSNDWFSGFSEKKEEKKVLEPIKELKPSEKSLSSSAYSSNYSSINDDTLKKLANKKAISSDDFKHAYCSYYKLVDLEKPKQNIERR